MRKPTLVTFSLYRFSTAIDKYWAFTGMGNSHRGFRNVPGMLFYKLLGSGAGEGFSVKPNFSVYAFMAVWESRETASDFFNSNSQIIEYQDKAKYGFNVNMRPLSSHGTWGGINPFETKQVSDLSLGPIAVLTRAHIRLRKLPDFWRYVPTAARSVRNAEGRIFSVGVGEWPLIEQATFSIWESVDAMRDYAYNRPDHARVVRMTRKRNWYSEELFARFVIEDVTGSWPDQKLTQAFPHLIWS